MLCQKCQRSVAPLRCTAFCCHLPVAMALPPQLSPGHAHIPMHSTITSASETLMQGILQVLIPAAVFIGLHNDDCCECFGHEGGGKSCAILSSVLAAFVGILGSGYCITISALGLSQGPYCFTHLERNWIYPFTDSSGGYLFEYNKWSECQEPQNIVQWNVTLFSILLVLGGIEFILCFIQIINGILGGLCGLCCSHEEAYVC
ncbi:transmembrane 4 L6 family member 1 isoform X2 [Cyanistes caeruleus]|uniref:Transmembrane 4 L six family member 1 n=1 Tax=Cyanistes caeruleus TaxID=156563 RepID=A0A8C0ZG42_CYACU|nr:transmembrane 4 L6 family member 1 isoform X2 [Cyanistes caeruleus]